MNSGEARRTMIEPTAADLEHDVDEARELWQEAARVMGLHRELASMYRTNSKDKRTIATLWERINEGEANLRRQGVYL
jgi:cellobiose-specific phosphotransferase system component IIA